MEIVQRAGILHETDGCVAWDSFHSFLMMKLNF